MFGDTARAVATMAMAMQTRMNLRSIAIAALLVGMLWNV